MKHQKSKDRGLIEYIKSNKKKVYASIGMILVFVFMLTTDAIVVPIELKKYVNNYWYTKTFSIFIFILILSLPLSITYKEQTTEDLHLTVNKLFWVFLIGIFSLTNVRNSYLYNVKYTEKMTQKIKYLNKEIQGLKQINNERHKEL